jgi:hypothetical protein
MPNVEGKHKFHFLRYTAPANTPQLTLFDQYFFNSTIYCLQTPSNLQKGPLRSKNENTMHLAI